MSALVDRVVSKHYKSVSAVDKCVCGLTLYGNLARHIADLTEAAVREQIAAELTALSDTAWDAYKNGFGIERADPFTEGQSDAYDTAATLAAGVLT